MWRPFYFVFIFHTQLSSVAKMEIIMETERNICSKSNNKIKIKEPSLYNIIMLNDDFTPMNFVVDILCTYFDKSTDEATALMLKVHREKKAVVAKYVYDVAITKTYRVTHEAREKGYPFKVIVEKDTSTN